MKKKTIQKVCLEKMPLKNKQPKYNLHGFVPH